MSISLFPHNQEAYNSLLETLETERRACIIHPTGTGKSFIGFKYCEDHPEQSVLWLSPSEYIFKTQCESLAAAGAQIPDNIKFMTYAKLSMMEPKELNALYPDVVILDEMHRAAAPTWEQPVQMLLSRNPVVIGLTATHIRYLDGQKDTTVTFSMNVASEMGLGEAIATGILPAPKYVVSIFAYEKDLERYQSKIRRARNKAVQVKAEEYLEALRRAIEKADGLDVIFKKHITDRNGKFILFVPNIEAMHSVKKRCPEWLREIDAKPRIYTAYSDDPETSAAFAAFKADNSKHLKVLLAINMLNEGVHVDDISGVILFRPTVSPIIYKQQIGRALSACRDGQPLILDIVANVYNLYTVDSLRNEIAEAIQMYRERGDGEKIEVEDFTIYDEVADCRKLFAQLDDVLSSSWEESFQRLVHYKSEFGHVNVPVSYKTPDGLSLGCWCNTQRRIYRGNLNGILTEERIKKLNSIGFLWNPKEESWMENYQAAAAFYREHHHLDIKCSFVTTDGVKLGNWISMNRTAFSKRKLSQERIQLLQKIGMIWDADEYHWMQNYEICRDYYLKHNRRIPGNYVAEDGSLPGRWLTRTINNHINRAPQDAPLRDDQIKLLEEIGVIFEKKSDAAWNRAIAAAEEYFFTYGNLDVPPDYVSGSGVKLRSWLDYQRRSYAGMTHSTLSEERKVQLDRLDFDWELRKKEDTWPSYYRSLQEYMNTHGGQMPLQKYVDDQGLKLGYWLSNQRVKYRRGELESEYERLLRKLGVELDNAKEKSWQTGFQHMLDYYRNNKTAYVPVAYKAEDGFALGEWLRTQIKNEASGILKSDRKAKLDKLGVRWKRQAKTAISIQKTQKERTGIYP